MTGKSRYVQSWFLSTQNLWNMEQRVHERAFKNVPNFIHNYVGKLSQKTMTILLRCKSTISMLSPMLSVLALLIKISPKSNLLSTEVKFISLFLSLKMLIAFIGEPPSLIQKKTINFGGKMLKADLLINQMEKLSCGINLDQDSRYFIHFILSSCKGHFFLQNNIKLLF